jgi:hypothetical protein
VLPFLAGSARYQPGPITHTERERMANTKKARPKKEKSGLTRFSVWLKRTDIARLEAIAKAETVAGYPELSVGFLIRHMVEEALDKRKS